MSKASVWLKKKVGIPEIDLTKFISGSSGFKSEVDRLKEIAATEIAAELANLHSAGGSIDSNKLKDALYARIQNAVTIPSFLEGPLSKLVAGYDAEKLEDKVLKKIPMAKIDELAENLINLIRGVKVS